MKTKNEIIKETVEYYWQDPKRRASTGLGCHYRVPDDGRMCAVGRCLTAEALPQASKVMVGAYELAGRLYADCLDDLLQPEYRGHSVDFWDRLQTVHDNEHIWDSEQLLRDRLNHWFPNFPFDSLNLTRPTE
jgi:hypothetical protein